MSGSQLPPSDDDAPDLDTDRPDPMAGLEATAELEMGPDFFTEIAPDEREAIMEPTQIAPALLEETAELTPALRAELGMPDPPKPRARIPSEVLEPEPEPESIPYSPEDSLAAALEMSIELEASPYEGDGPFAAPLDMSAGAEEDFVDAVSDVDVNVGADSALDVWEGPAPRLPEPARSIGVPNLGQRPPISLQRKEQPTKALTVAEARNKLAVSPSRPKPAAPERKAPPRYYPKMLAKLREPQKVPYGNEPVRTPPPPPVPGTFFPAAREPMGRPQVVDLDALLLTMAEGLLIGETPEGHTEVRVTLKDEFFAGTELRIVSGDGQLSAVFVPPDRDIYWQLNAHIDDLRDRLGGRGLRVEDITVQEP